MSSNEDRGSRDDSQVKPSVNPNPNPSPNPREPQPVDRRWAEDWSDPEALPRMSAGLPLLWMLVPLVGCILWGWLA